MTKDKFKPWAMLSAALLMGIVSYTQSIAFKFTDGTRQSYDLQDVQKATFANDVMNLHLTDGTVYSWSVKNIEECRLDEPATVTGPQGTTLAPMKVYPNPTTGNLAVEYALETEAPVSLEVRDMQSRTVRLIELGTQPAGRHIAFWDGTDAECRPAAAGSYFCRIVTPRVQMGHTFIIQ